MWSKINNILQMKKRLDETLHIYDNGITISDPTTTKIAYKFNNYFQIYPKSFSKKLGKTNSKFQDYLKNPNNNCLFLKEAEPGKV